MSRARARRKTAQGQTPVPPPAPPPPRTYRIEILPPVFRELSRLPEDARKQIGQKINALATDPCPHQVEKLAATENLYRVCTGHDRIIYQIRDDVLTIAVVKVGDRKDVYRQIEELRKRLR